MAGPISYALFFDQESKLTGNRDLETYIQICSIILLDSC